jgi:predicted aspartyl protease
MSLRGTAFALGLLWLAHANGAAAACVDSDQLRPELLPTAGVETVEVASRRSGRMVAPVMVNGYGPFRFIVDTGANRSAVSQQVAERLGLVTNGDGDVHTVHGVTRAPLVGVDSLHFGQLPLASADMPVLHGPMLAGEEGLLGVDGLRGRRLRMDFEHRCIEISPSQPTRRRHGWTLVPGELRFGHLVVVEGRIGDETIAVMIDTGSDSTLANVALRNRLRAHVRIDEESTANARAYTAGTPIVLDNAVIVPRFSLGDVEVRNITAYVGDFHIFRLWDLIDQPALLIGMDVLSQTRALIIDYQEADVFFRLHSVARTGSRLPDSGSNTRVSIIR